MSKWRRLVDQHNILKPWNLSSRWEPLSSECSNSCGEGVKHIKYQCIQRFLKSQQTNPVDSTFCSNIPTPRTMEKCHGTCPDATWSYGDWDLVNHGGTINQPCFVTPQ